MEDREDEEEIVAQMASMEEESSSSSLRGGAAAAPAPAAAATLKEAGGFFHSIRVAFAGGIAGAVGTAILYPLDTAKTLRQANPTKYKSVRHALLDLLLWGSNPEAAEASATASAWKGKKVTRCLPRRLPDTGAGAADAAVTKTLTSRQLFWLKRYVGLRRVYAGVIPATLGAIPSSALYFGGYEVCKRWLSRKWATSSSSSQTLAVPTSTRLRLAIHALSAACGNTASSLLFVPKEYIKQQMQYHGSSKTFWQILNDTFHTRGGVVGLYCGYKATLLRNIPSAILRFALYEEVKYRLVLWQMAKQQQEQENNAHSMRRRRRRSISSAEARAYQGGGLSVMFFLAGAMAGAIASGTMTPLDVVKTRLATGTLPVECGFWTGTQYILQNHGIRGLYAGARARMVWSGAFSAIGFGTFEAVKGLLGVGGGAVENKEEPNKGSSSLSSSRRMPVVPRKRSLAKN